MIEEALDGERSLIVPIPIPEYGLAKVSCSTDGVGFGSAVKEASMRSMWLLLLILVIPTQAFAENLYVAQTTAGFDKGSSCANAHGATWFNNAGNWGDGTDRISAGDTVHLCGTITTALRVQGNGSLGSIITILFETGAQISPSSCGGSGCLNVEGKSYITVDGGRKCGYVNQRDTTCNGKIYITTAKPAPPNYGIVANGCNNCEIKNLQIGPLFQRTAYDGSGSGLNRGITNAWGTVSGSTFLVHNNVLRDIASAIVYIPGQQNDNGFQAYNNYVYNINSSVDIGNINSGTLTAALIHDNHFSTTGNWDDTGCPGHHNSLHAFAQLGTNGGWNSGIDYYNNLVDGDWGNCATAMLFIEGGNNGHNRNVRIWNNLFNGTYVGMFIGIASVHGDGPLYFYNNTILGKKVRGDVCFGTTGDGVNTSINFQNNIVSGCHTLLSYNSTTLGDWDYNLYGGNTWNKGTPPPVWYSTLAAWQAATGKDLNSVYGQDDNYVMVNPNGTLQPGSPAIGIGANLTGFGISALNRDIIRVVRSPSGSWDAGAYAYSGGGTVPTPPTGLGIN